MGEEVGGWMDGAPLHPMSCGPEAHVLVLAETTHLAECDHGLSGSDVLLLLQVTPRQPLPLQDPVEGL